MMVVAAIVTLAIRLGMLSGTMTLVMICSGVAPMLWAASMTPASTSRILVSTRRDTNGNDAMTSGTMDATVPMDVPTMARDSGMTMIIKIKNGTLRSRFTRPFSSAMSQRGRGRTPPCSPVTRQTPSGRPMTSASSVATTVDQTVSHVSNGMVGKICKNVCHSLPAKSSAISRFTSSKVMPG